MWSSLNQINLIRYLFVCRVNRALVKLPSCLSGQLSLVLGSTITHRLPTTQARSWRKALASWAEYQDTGRQTEATNKASRTKGQKKKGQPVPEISWPVETVLFVYPGKVMYGPGELILWELRLLGEQADHGFFLEVILPALEEIGSTASSPWYRQNSLWGRFDIRAVYVARGGQWEPVVSEGKLDVRYQATPTQWAEGTTFGLNLIQKFDTLTWLTPFDFTPYADDQSDSNLSRPPKKTPAQEVPTLSGLLEALITRIAYLLPGKYTTSDDVWNLLSTEEQLSLVETMNQANHISIRNHTLKPASKHWPGRWIGRQTFSEIPALVIPYFELASILHLGRQTHFGCGTFTLS